MTLEKFVELYGLELRTTKVTTELNIYNPRFPIKGLTETSFACKCEILLPVRRWQIEVHKNGERKLMEMEIAKLRNETPEAARKRLVDELKGSILVILSWYGEAQKREEAIKVPEDLE